MPNARTGTALALVLMVPLLGGCQTQEQTGGLLGGGVGALAGGLIGNSLGGSTGAAIGAALGAAGGYFVGSAIGRQLDEQDRQRAEAATQRALAEPVRYASPAAPTAAPPPRPVAWNSARHADVRGTAQVTSVHREAAGGECRMVRETAYISGREVVQNTRYCRSAGGNWVAQT